MPYQRPMAGGRAGQDFHALKIRDHEIPLYGFDLPALARGSRAPSR